MTGTIVKHPIQEVKVLQKMAGVNFQTGLGGFREAK
jgi:hypothetical protein